MMMSAEYTMISAEYMMTWEYTWSVDAMKRLL
jgi:hypothetical protein